MTKTTLRLSALAVKKNINRKDAETLRKIGLTAKAQRHEEKNEIQQTNLCAIAP